MKKVRKEKHHTTPKSRGGNVTKSIPSDYHLAYHKLFENLTPDEILEYLQQVWFVSGKFIRPLEWLHLKKHS